MEEQELASLVVVVHDVVGLGLGVGGSWAKTLPDLWLRPTMVTPLVVYPTLVALS
jgi:hypothetical protein